MSAVPRHAAAGSGTPGRRPLWPRVLMWLVVAIVLAGVFMAYASPMLMMELANQTWACF